MKPHLCQKSIDILALQKKQSSLNGRHKFKKLKTRT